VLQGGVAYVIDHHHHLAALDLSGFDSVDVTLSIACTLGSMTVSDVFQYLSSRGFAYFYGRPAGSPDTLPAPVKPSAMPVTLSFRANNITMADDRWRALSGFARKVDSCAGCSSGAANHNYGCRAYDRVCASSGQGIPFFEYRWAYFFNDAAAVNTSLWSSASAAQTFQHAMSALSSPSPDAPVSDVDDWKAAAALLVPLARGASAGGYAVPASMGLMGGALPGYRGDLSPFPHDDPDCNLPSC